MAKPKEPGYSVELFMPDGDPKGIRTVTKSNWNGLGFVFPRSKMKEALQRIGSLRTAVYLLISSENPAKPEIYIGETDKLNERTKHHDLNKEFWTWAILFTRSDNSLHKTLVLYLESRLYSIAVDLKQCELHNTKTPDTPTIKESAKSEAEVFLENILLCLPILGINAFEQIDIDEVKGPEFKITRNNTDAKGKVLNEGFVVIGGSIISSIESAGIPASTKELRRVLKNNGVLANRDDQIVFTKDYLFNSPSMAAGVVLGMSTNGRTEWVTNDGKTLKEIQEAQ